MKMKDYIKLGFGVSLGVSAYKILATIYTFVFVGIGALLIQNFNKEGTELVEELHIMQIVGIVLAMFGILPWIHLFLGLFLNAILSDLDL